jgi:hypothetical protein
VRVWWTLRQRRSSTIFLTFVLANLMGLVMCDRRDLWQEPGVPAVDRVALEREQTRSALPTLWSSPTPRIRTPDRAIMTFAATSDGALWYAFDEYDDGGGAPPDSQHHGLYRSLDGRVSHFDVPGTIRMLAEAPDGRLYIGAGRGILRYGDGSLETLIDVERGQESFAWAFVPFDIAFAPNDDVWVGGVYSLARYDGKTWTQYEVNVRRLLVAPNGSVWGQGWDGRAGSDCCYVHVTGDSWVTHTHSAELPVSGELLADLDSLKN